MRGPVSCVLAEYSIERVDQVGGGRVGRENGAYASDHDQRRNSA
jgi:hypothetical protein